MSKSLDITGITVTERAAHHIVRFLEKRKKGVGLRIGVRTSGCSGMAYQLEFSNSYGGIEDIQFISHGITLIVDLKSVPYINGMELDYAREGLHEGFQFNNPNVTNSCGCGESFQTS